MAHVGSLRNVHLGEHTDADDIRGVKVYGRNDEKLGEIADVIFDHSTGEVRYAVVDTGGWFQHKQFLVPADRIEARGDDRDADDYRVNLSREEVERFPKYDPDAVNDEERWTEHEREYRGASDQYFAGSDVLHRADSANIITDPGIPAASGGGLENVDARVRPIAGNVIAGAMNTSANAFGQQQDTRRLTPAMRTDAFEPDIKSTDPDQEALDIQRGGRPVNEDAPSAVDPTGRGLDQGIGRREYAPEEEEIRDRDLSAATVSDPDFRLNRTTTEPFRRRDVGAESAESDRLEQQYDRDDADMYQASRSGQPLPGEFVNAGNSPSGTTIAGNAPNSSDSEVRTMEGDSRFNVADPQLRDVEGAAYTSDSGVTPELSDLRRGQETQGLGSTRRGPQSEDLGARVGNRWQRFQDRLRNDRDHLTGDCPGCERDRNRAA